MTQATDCTSSGFTVPFLSTITASKITKSALAVVLAFTLLESTSLAEEEPVMIVPRAQAASGDSAKPNPSSTEPSSQTAVPGTQQPTTPPAAQNQPADSTLVLPAGTKLPLGLVRPLSLKSSSAKGTGVYLQVTFPVAVAGRMVVPPGAYVQGTIEKMTVKRGSNPDLEFELRSASLIFSTGYTASLTGTVEMVHNNARLMPPGTPSTNDGTVAMIPHGTSNVSSPSMSAVGTAPTPAPLPSLGNGPRDAIIAVGAVGAAAIVGVTIFALHHRNDVYLDAGTPLEITLAEPLKLDASNVTNAVQQYSAQMATAPPEIVKPPRRPKMCYAPGTPGTPDTRIPGTPPTPPTVIPGMNGAPATVIPGNPGTPDTVIPGTPGTPGSWYRCP
ncbi:MAG TPA: hypothetical protein VFP71_15170 [Candidatus Angelobacter sp.]|nr:hypothetical protein [Candidatus Angelobacter sp.]